MKKTSFAIAFYLVVFAFLLLEKANATCEMWSSNVYFCLSTDSKPSAENFSRLYETDTVKVYLRTGDAWVEIVGANDPSTDQKAALAGTSGAPSGSNKYVTNVDSRNSDARTPTAHTQAWSTITSTPTTLAGYSISDAAPKSHSDLTNLNAHGGIATGALTLPNLTNALNSGDYSINLKNYKTTSAGYGLVIDSDIARNNLILVNSAGSTKLQMRATTGYTGEFIFDTSAMGAVFGALNFISPGILGTIKFTTGSNSLGFNPGANSVTTSNANSIGLSVSLGASSVASFATTAWVPTANSDQDLGGTSNQFKDFFQQDGGKHYFGDAQDAAIYRDGTDLIVNPKLVGSGKVDIQGTAEVDALIVTAGGSSGKAICWKTATTLGYCSSAVASDGSCTCN